MSDCGIAGVYVFDENSLRYSLYEILCALQHRGQESVGISYYDGTRLITRTEMELVSRSRIFSGGIKGKLGIGHNRYSTTGRSTIENAHPIEMESNYGVRYAFAFNGNVANDDELRTEINKKYQLRTTCDAELLGYLLGNELGNKSIEETYRETFGDKVKGSCSGVMLIADDNPKVVVLRDPLGIMPICIGENSGGLYAASESVAFSDPYVSAKFIGDVEPGEVVIIDENGFHHHQIFNSPVHAHCMFQYVYQARPSSVIDGILVHDVRKRLGELSHRDCPVKADRIAPIPDSGRSFAIGLSIASGVLTEELFDRDRYLYSRSFMMPEQKQRDDAARKKLVLIPTNLEGKVVLPDDSIVRGTTSRKGYISKLKLNGVKEVELRISCPPIIGGCPYGIDIYHKELIARKHMGKTHEETCKLVGEELGVDLLYYNRIPALVEAIGLPDGQLCLGCLTGKYPHDINVKSKEERKK